MGDKRRILVVDDDPDICITLKEILELENYEVETAPDGYKALEAAKARPFDAVLMDIKMPGINGVETFKRLKEIAPETPAIMITAFAVEELIEEALREGAFAAMTKPINFDRLFAALELSRKDGAVILIADHERSHAQTVDGILQEKGYRVRRAENHTEALQLAREGKYDVILIDLKLPPTGGLDAWRQIRRVRKEPAVIAIANRSRVSDEIIEAILKEGAYAFFEKPIDFEKFFPVLEKILSD